MSNKIIVTTTDLKESYDVIGPVYFSVSTRGLFGSNFHTLEQKYKKEIQNLKKKTRLRPTKYGSGNFWPGGSPESDRFDNAFFIAVEELKARASNLSADAIVGLRQDIVDIDYNYHHFHLQVYGTAIKFK